MVSADGKQAGTIVPADCHARVAHADGKRGVVVVACLRESGTTLDLYGAGAPVSLIGRLSEERLPRVDRWDYDRPRFVAFADGSFVDLDRRTLASETTLEPRQARPAEWREREKGVFAVRGDGFELVPEKQSAFWKVPKGPLRWRRAPARH